MHYKLMGWGKPRWYVFFGVQTGHLKKKGGMHFLCSKHTQTHPAIVSTVTGYKLNEPWCDSRQGQEIFISFLSAPKLTGWVWGQSCHLFNGSWGSFCRGLVGKLLGCEVNHLQPLALRLRMNEAIPLFLLYVFMAYTWIYLYMCKIITKPT